MFPECLFLLKYHFICSSVTNACVGGGQWLNNNMAKTLFLFLAFNVQGFLGDKTDDHECNMDANALKQLKNEMWSELNELSRKLEEQNKEMLVLRKELAEMLSNGATRDLPYKVACAFANQWTKEGTTVSYDYMLSDFDNSGEFIFQHNLSRLQMC